MGVVATVSLVLYLFLNVDHHEGMHRTRDNRVMQGLPYPSADRGRPLGPNTVS
jgi:hypothetical protein